MKKTIFLVVILMFSLQVIPFSYVNDIECTFLEGPEKSALSENLINGSIHFLKSKSYADLFLYEYEKSALQAFNFSISFEHIEKAAIELESAKSRYEEAIKIGKRIGYNVNKVAWFKSYNYSEFNSYSNLNNKEIVQRAKDYLAEGDILGIYQHCVNDIDSILDTLYGIKGKIKSGAAIELDIVWKLLQQYSESTLFGNYATVMGSKILGQYDGACSKMI